MTVVVLDRFRHAASIELLTPVRKARCELLQLADFFLLERQIELQEFVVARREDRPRRGEHPQHAAGEAIAGLGQARMAVAALPTLRAHANGALHIPIG